jgi:hypothetical protein
VENKKKAWPALCTQKNYRTHVIKLDIAPVAFPLGQHLCAAKAFYSCPAIISQRLESRIISKEPQENTEEESKII